YLGSGEVPRRSGGTDSVIAIYQTFHTADKPLTLAIGNNGQWKRFWSCVGEPAVGEEPAYATNAMRRAKRAEIVECIQALLRARPRDEWLRQFERMRVPCGPINGVDEVTADVELQARGLFYRVDRGGSAIPQVGTGIRLDGQANGVRRPPPALGTDTAEVLREWLGE
ncbi:MAG: CoA transferase, partial [Betaproteobacteria bacterium]